jgi:hypothetical protein
MPGPGPRRSPCASRSLRPPHPLQLRCLTARGGKQRYLGVPIGVELTNFSKRMAGKVDKTNLKKKLLDSSHPPKTF